MVEIKNPFLSLSFFFFMQNYRRKFLIELSRNSMKDFIVHIFVDGYSIEIYKQS